jgi:signal transduction histidine kinase/DNA-binding response OmpR family regulator
MARVLVVDDEPLVAHALKALLASNGFDAISAESGEEALGLLETTTVDLVFLDVILPGLSGFETCARIRERLGPTLPVVLISARPDPDAVRTGYEAGADDFLAKPVDQLALVLKVRVLLRLKALHDQLLESREELKKSVEDMALLHEIGRDWSLIAEPGEFHRIVTERLAALIGAPICLIALYDPATRSLAAALPVHGLPDAVARRIHYTVTPELRALWNFKSGRAYLSNRARSDPRLKPEVIGEMGAESVLLVPMVAEGHVLGVIVAVNKPGGFTDADGRLLSIFAGPAATFLRSRQIFEQERLHAARLERLSELTREMAGATGRAPLLALAVTRIRQDFGCERVAFFVAGAEDRVEKEAEAKAEASELDSNPELVRWVLRGGRPLRSAQGDAAAELALAVRAGDEVLGALALVRSPELPIGGDEESLLAALAGQLAVMLKNVQSLGSAERLARQMATLYDVGLETSALRDLRSLFVKGAEEAGRLIGADHTSVFRFDEASGTLTYFAGWGRQASRGGLPEPVFRLGEGIAGRVARDWMPAMVNDADAHAGFVPKSQPVQRLLCVPVTYYDQEREAAVLFGVLNATRRPGASRFTNDDIEYLTRFAGQLSIAVANTMAFAGERERSEQLALVNTLFREIAGSLSRERILETAARRIHEAFGYPLVVIGVPVAGSDEIRIAVGASREAPAQGWTGSALAKPGAHVAVRERRTVLKERADASPAPGRLLPSTCSELSVPVRVADEALAVLVIESEQPRAFTRARVMTLETLAEGIAIILRNAELYNALEQTNAKLVELDRTKSELVNIVAHDFRSPLAGVLGHAELLEWRPDAPKEERIEQARAIIQSATHMAAMVDKTLKTTRLETGHLPFEFGVTDLGAVVREVLARQPSDAQHPLEVQLPEDPLPCWSDRERIAEVVENLVSNAIKYSPQGGPVRVDASLAGEWLTVRVGDRGIGIATEHRDRLFRPFSRVRTRQTAEIEGTGLGLYICERIVKAHGGRMWAESEPGVGSTFAFSLPLFGAAAQTRLPVILLAAGDEATRREAQRVADELGYGLHAVSDGVEAVEDAMRLLPVVVVADRVLPKLGAVEIAGRLREAPATASIPVIALAPTDDLGGDPGVFAACLPKPVQRAVMAATVEAVAGRRVPGR